MLLRNGKIYTYDVIYKKRSIKKIININKYEGCSICGINYKSNDIICSCSIKNINKHSFHKDCIKTYINTTSDYEYDGDTKKVKCPYCYTLIKGRLNYVKII